MFLEREYYNIEQLKARVKYREEVSKLRYEKIKGILTGDVEVILREVYKTVTEIIREGLLDFQPEYLQQAEFLQNYVDKVNRELTQPEHIHVIVDDFMLILIQGLTNPFPF